MTKKKSLSRDIKDKVRQRAEGFCEYCLSQEKYASQGFSVDHIIPKKAGGSDDPGNLCLACQGCNNFKYTKTEALDPTTGEVVPLFNPRIDLWKEHFQWNENFTIIQGLTPIGRATVNALKLNRELLLNQRVLYRTYGIHPPKHTLVENRE